MSVRQTDGPSWKIHVCSRNKWTLLENYIKVAPGKKEQIFSVSVAASESSYETMSRPKPINEICRGKIEAPGKYVCVRRLNKGFSEN